MSISTAWLSRHATLPRRGGSPVRPTADSIERLSPEPAPATPPRFSSGSGRVKRESNGTFLHGLGLSNALHGRTESDTDGLYLDSNGRAHLGTKVKSPRQDLTATKSSRPSTTHYRGPPKRSHPGHVRTASIDDLANIAIATSPQFANFSTSFAAAAGPTYPNASRPSTSYINGYIQDSFDRPAKRIKSERLHAAEWAQPDQRPRSSYAFASSTTEITLEDAELLLSLQNPISFKASPAPSSRIPRPSLFASSPPRKAHTDDSVPSASSPTSGSRDPPLGSTVQKYLKDLTHVPAASTEPVSTITTHITVPTVEPWSPGALPELPLSVDHVPTSADPISEGAIAIEQEQQESSVKEEVQEDQEGHGVADATDLLDPEPYVPAIQAASGTTEEEAQSHLKPQPDVPAKPRRIVVDTTQPVCPTCNQINSNAREGEATIDWIKCEGACNRWFHIPCAGFTDQDVKKVAKFICKDCEPVHGRTTFARTSTRTRAAPDYAALNEGVAKPSDNANMHHFVGKFKDGSIKYQQDNFARIRPELMTQELWENFDGMKRPFVVPAIWNPRFGSTSTTLQPHPVSADDLTRSYVAYSSNGDELGEYTQLDHVTAPWPLVDEEIIELDQDYLGMVMPRNLSVRKVAELYGPDEPVPVIDVKTQNVKGNFTLRQWATYYEEPGIKPVRNVISLEVSHSRLGRLIRRPDVVRHIDLEDQVWDIESRTAASKRPVAFYCLMSVGDSYTDFHIDFGGSSVYYHILEGRKTFFFIPPTDKYLKKYEEWNDTANQNSIWLGDWCDGNVTRVDLFPGDTAFIPAGWIHSVWTPEDSLVIGGNFLTRYDLDMQLKVVEVEKNNRTSPKYRYPMFQKVMWYTLIKYLESDPLPQSIIDDFLEDPHNVYIRPFPIWHLHDSTAAEEESGEDQYNARNYSKSEMKGLHALRDFLHRTARIHADLPVEGKLDKTKKAAVKSSVPKGYGDPMQLIREFAVWIAWKRGNETAPEWLHSDSDVLQEQEAKDAARKSDSTRIPGERMSTRRKAQPSNPPLPDTRATPDGDDRKESPTPKALGPRIACIECRRKRLSCRHASGTRLEESAQQTLEKTRTYSNVSIDIARLARASPVVNSIEGSTAPPKQAPHLASPAATSVIDENTIEVPASSDLAPAALTRMTSPFEQNGIAINGAPSTPGFSRDQMKKGRSKACDECRKSKRRCVHDEHGRVDPAKAAEPSKPRGSSTAKRPPRLSDEHQSKRVKLEDDYAIYGSNQIELDAMIDPALMAPTDSMYGMYQTHPMIMTDVNTISTPPHTLTPQESFVSTAIAPIPSVEQSLDPSLMDPALLEPLSHPASAVIEETARTHISTLPKLATAALVGAVNSNTPDIDKSFSPITADGMASKSGSEEAFSRTVQTPVPTSHTDAGVEKLKQAQTNGVVRDPSGSNANDTFELATKGRRNLIIDNEQVTEQTTPPQAQSRRSTSQISALTTDPTNTPSPKSRGTRRQSNISTDQPTSPPPTIEPTAIMTTPTQQLTRVTSSSSGTDEDPSERLARELQAQEHGLRRRASVRTS